MPRPSLLRRFGQSLGRAFHRLNSNRSEISEIDAWEYSTSQQVWSNPHAPMQETIPAPGLSYETDATAQSHPQMAKPQPGFGGGPTNGPYSGYRAPSQFGATNQVPANFSQPLAGFSSPQ
ncbi:MAG: hypothetical protein ABGZ17_21075 [Planctomycetaceae bacterium]